MTPGNKSIMIVAGGDWQVPIIKKAKAMGYYVINSNLYKDSPGFLYADIGLVADVLDREKNLEFARQYRPNAVITDQTDVSVFTVAYICEKLGLPGIGMDKAELFTNKYSMREFCKKNGLSVPEYRLCRNIEDVQSFGRSIGYPFVIKPTSNQSSRGVHKIGSEEDLHKNFPDTISQCSSGLVLAEEFIPGPEFTVEGFKTHSRCYSLAVSMKKHFAHAEMVASHLLYSRTNPQYDYDELRHLNARLVEMMGLPFGITHAEYKHHRGRFTLIEIAARGGGTKISSHIIPEMSGVDVNELLIRCASGERFEEINLVLADKWVILNFFLFPSGTVKKINALDWLEANASVIDYGMNFKPGDTLKPPADDRARHGYFIARADSEQEIMKLSNEIKRRVTVEYE